MITARPTRPMYRPPPSRPRPRLRLTRPARRLMASRCRRLPAAFTVGEGRDCNRDFRLPKRQAIRRRSAALSDRVPTPVSAAGAGRAYLWAAAGIWRAAARCMRRPVDTTRPLFVSASRRVTFPQYKRLNKLGSGLLTAALVVVLILTVMLGVIAILLAYPYEIEGFVLTIALTAASEAVGILLAARRGRPPQPRRAGGVCLRRGGGKRRGRVGAVSRPGSGGHHEGGHRVAPCLRPSLG